MLSLCLLLINETSAQKVYWGAWTIGDQGEIRRANLDGSDPETLVPGLDRPEGVAVDPIRGKLYWTEEGAGRIQKSDLDGSGAGDIVTGLVQPFSLALDLVNDKIYWVDGMLNNPGIIQRANLDGTNMKDVVASGLTLPAGIAIDSENGKLYWTDSLALGSGIIQRSNLDGSGVEDLVTGGLDNPRGIALDVSGGKMYWAENVTDKIQRANLDGTTVEDLLPAANPTAIVLDLAADKMYWTESSGIRRANLDGDQAEDVLLDSVFPGWVALDILTVVFINDCNGNDIPDEDEIASGDQNDCNGNAVPDVCDVETGLRADSALLYRCDENAGSTVFDFSGNGNDASSVGVTYSSDTPFPILGNFALAFDDEADAVTIPADPATNLNSYTDLTLEAHIKPTDTGNLHYILWADGDPFSLFLRNDALTFSLTGSIGSTSVSSPFTATGQWTHVAGSYDGVTARLYANGAEVATQAAAVGTIQVSPVRNIIRIGNDETADLVGFERDFAGLIDQVRIANRALAPQEILFDAAHSMVPGVSYTTPGDLSGLQGIPDCRVNLFDHAELAANFPDGFGFGVLLQIATNWLACVDINGCP